MPRLFVIDDRDQTVELCHRYLGDFEYVNRCGRSIPCQVCEQERRGCRKKCAHDYLEAESTLMDLERLPDLVVLDLHFALPLERLLPEDKPELPTEPRALAQYTERLRRHQGLLILERLRQRYPRLPVVMLTTTDTELGTDRPHDPLVYLCQNEVVDSRSLIAEIRRALALSHETQEGAVFWGKSSSMAAVRRSLSVLARSPLPTLIEGETGTGKSYLAEHFIHPRSGAKGSLVVTDLSTIPPSLLPSHLFGVRKGAYTGATSDHAGVFEQAHQGTLFLDEIANLDLDLQRQLLVVLERNEVTRLGDQRPRPAVTKLIAATHQNLEDLVQAGRFRADLYMRLNPASRVRLPPLRERPDDVVDLVRHGLLEALGSTSLSSLVHAFLVRHPTLESFSATANAVLFRRPSARSAKPNAFTVFVSPTALDRLRQHSWPGNHRELRLFATNALVFTLCQQLETPTDAGPAARAPAVLALTDDLVERLLQSTAPGRVADAPRPCTTSGSGFRCTVDVPSGRGFAQVSMQVERQYLEQIYLQHRGDLDAMAKRLLGPKATARQVHLRMNQLGLGIKSLRQKLVRQEVQLQREEP
ncbi:MAG: sigma 54-interacting transcriptional regulator [Polyangiaceae bacterium]|nr:sigma 54-interacting transcriptional regulator [Polyangiaceae bacterium]